MTERQAHTIIILLRLIFIGIALIVAENSQTLLEAMVSLMLMVGAGVMIFGSKDS